MSKVEAGKKVTLHYVGTFEDGVQFDSSRDRGEPLEFTAGSGQLIPGFDSGILGLTVGDTKTISVDPEHGYGEVREDVMRTYPMSSFPEGTELTEGSMITGHDQQGQPMIARVVTVSDEEAVLDFNHPLAGKQLNFEVEILSVE